MLKELDIRCFAIDGRPKEGSENDYCAEGGGDDGTHGGRRAATDSTGGGVSSDHGQHRRAWRDEAGDGEGKSATRAAFIDHDADGWNCEQHRSDDPRF
jgi:hypothetical protein